MKRKTKLGLKGHFTIKGRTIFYDSNIYNKDILYVVVRKALNKGYNLKEYFLDEIKKDMIDIRYSADRPAKEEK